MILPKSLIAMVMLSSPLFAESDTQESDYEASDAAAAIEVEDGTLSADEDLGEMDLQDENDSPESYNQHDSDDLMDSAYQDDQGEEEVDLFNEQKLAKNEKKPVMKSDKKAAAPSPAKKSVVAAPAKKPAVAAPAKKPAVAAKGSATPTKKAVSVANKKADVKANQGKAKVEQAKGKVAQSKSKVEQAKGKFVAAKSNPTSSVGSGDILKKVQAALNAKGEKLTVDGQAGPRTKAALKRFQSKNSLPSTGNPDSKTLAKLGVK